MAVTKPVHISGSIDNARDFGFEVFYGDATRIDLLRTEPLDVILLAGRWTLLDRDAEAELVDLARDKGTSFVLGGIYNSGILAKGPVPGAWFNYQPASEAILAQVRDLEARAKAEGATLPQAAMQPSATIARTAANERLVRRKSAQA